MADNKELLLKDFNYSLDDDRIAKYPLEKRDTSKLLVYKPGEEISQSVFNQLPGILPEKSLLVFNNTKVLHARLKFQKTTGASIEIFCLKPVIPSDCELSMAQTSMCQWKCIIGNKRKWKSGKLQKTLFINNDDITLSAEIIYTEKESHTVQFEWDKGVDFASILEVSGQIPIPPYLNRQSEDIDTTRYQTVFAKRKGSVAAPTASLHYTDELIEEIQKAGHQIEELTLHVGAGTFQPIKTDDVTQHKMHAELLVVKKENIRNLIRHQGHIVANGTTVMRTLESVYWLGVNLEKGAMPEKINQWVWKEFDQPIPKQKALENIQSYLEENSLAELEINTEIMITPGYDFQMVDVLITNFHQPKSTLLMLVSAFVKDKNWETIYDYALANQFRFLSYGDGSILFKA